MTKKKKKVLLGFAIPAELILYFDKPYDEIVEEVLSDEVLFAKLMKEIEKLRVTKLSSSVMLNEETIRKINKLVSETGLYRRTILSKIFEVYAEERKANYCKEVNA
ncbi:hypothetical protein [Hydrogenobacter thermophilus]|jgi:hypothetical protein|uniref:hypothetical protein n=1 Tax=Hydrogenobacter thermophilus TaxID=940 RepID=UPI0030FC7CC0